MSETTTPQEPALNAPPARRRSAGKRKEDWIGEQLRRVYDEAVQEAIPQRMIDLLNALDEPGDRGDK